MIQANNVTLRVGKKALFEDVNIKFTEGNCYGLSGAVGTNQTITVAFGKFNIDIFKQRFFPTRSVMLFAEIISYLFFH